MGTENGFSTVFNRLCHMAVLSQDGRLKTVVDNLVRSALVLAEAPVSNVGEASASIERFYGLKLPEHLVQGALDRLRKKLLAVPALVVVSARRATLAVNAKVADAWARFLRTLAVPKPA